MKKGFTLIEVLIVVIILGILATLALPQFTKMTKRATLAEAWGGLGGLRTCEAIYYMERTTYTTSVAALDWDTPGGTVFTYTIPAASATVFTAQATGIAGTKAAGVTAWIWGGAAASGNTYSL